MRKERRYEYRIEAPGRPEHGQTFTVGPDSPRMFAREPFQLRDGTMVHCEFVKEVQS